MPESDQELRKQNPLKEDRTCLAWKQREDIKAKHFSASKE